MKQICDCHSTFPIGPGEGKVLIDAFLFDSPSRDNGWEAV